jgi:hypothetical protein
MHCMMSRLELRYLSSPGFAHSLWQSSLWCRYAIHTFHLQLLNQKCRMPDSNENDAYALWRKFTTRFVHSLACQFTRTFRPRKCLTKLRSMLGKSCWSLVLVAIQSLLACSTLQKFDSCLRSQRELGTIKRLFKQPEITAQMDSCETELRAFLAIFTVSSQFLL